MDGLKTINQEPDAWQIYVSQDKQYFIAHREKDLHQIYLKSRLSVGQVVYVREAWQVCDLIYDEYNGGWEAGYPLKEIPKSKPEYKVALFYKLDGDDGPFRSPLFMPAWAARFFLQVVSVRPELFKIEELTQEELDLEGGKIALEYLEEYDQKWVFRYGIKRVERPEGEVSV